MELNWITPEHITYIWLTIAFICGFIVKQAGLPPLTGFLGAGFLLNALGLTEGTIALDRIADIGILIMLFTIGLKLKLKSLLKPEIWAGTTLHTVITTMVTGGIIFLLSSAGLSLISSLTFTQSILTGFALSFSSTVFAVKILEEKGTMTSDYGKTAIGILVMQDIFAVLFLTFSKGTYPDIWAVGLPAFLIVFKFILYILIKRTGHGELFTLFGIFAFLTVAILFEHMGLKADLGALVAGILLSDHQRSDELSKNLLRFKDLFLVAFFFQIGLTGAPGVKELLAALMLCLFIPFKGWLFLHIFNRFKLNTRKALFSTVTLANFSEFGLIVTSLAYREGMLPGEWLVISALALSISFIFASPLNSRAEALYNRLPEYMKREELAENREAVELSQYLSEHMENKRYKAVIAGMGRVGSVIYERMKENFGKDEIFAMDFDEDTVKLHGLRKNIIMGDISDRKFLQALIKYADPEMMILAIPINDTLLQAVSWLKEEGYRGKICTMAKYDDEVATLRKAGADIVFNLYNEAATGFANHICQSLCSLK